MSIVHNGLLRSPGGVLSFIAKNVKAVNLKAVKRITVSFDPFAKNVRSTREVLFHMSVERVNDTNPNCILKTNILCDRSEPTIVFDLIPKVYEDHQLKSVKLRSGNLTTLEILELINEYISPLAPVEEAPTVVKTRAARKK